MVALAAKQPRVQPHVKALREYRGEGSETFHLAEVNLGELLIPPFQRDEVPASVNKMAAEWDRSAYPFPVVALWENLLVCLDGQQRLAAERKRAGDLYVAVLLIEGVKTVERLSEIFLHYNRDRRLLGAFEKYIGALHAKDRGTVDIDKAVVSEFGLEVAKSSNNANRIPAGAVMRIHSMPNGSDLLRRVLSVRSAAWGDQPCREANESRTLHGIATFLRRHWKDVDDERLVKVLRRRHPGYILTAISASAARITYADYLREQYNRGLRGKARL